MSDVTIDKLKIEVESEAKNAASTLDDLTNKLEKLSAGIGKLDISKLTSLKTALRDIGNIKFAASKTEINNLNTQINKLADSTSRKLSKNLIDAFNITDKNMQQDVKSMCAQLMKLESAMTLKGGDSAAKSAADTMRNLATTVADSARVGTDEAIKSYQEFYSYLRSMKNPIYVPEQARNSSWDDMRKSFASRFTTDPSKGTSIDKVYQGLSGTPGWSDLFPSDISTEEQQFERIIEVLGRYRDMLLGVKDTQEGVFENNQRSAISMIGKYADEYEKAAQKILAVQNGNQVPAAYQNATDISGMTGLAQATDKMSVFSDSIKNLPKGEVFASLEGHMKSIVESSQGSEAVSALADGISKLSASMASIPNLSNFSRFAEGLSRLNNAETGNFNAIAESLDRLAASASALTNSGFENIKVTVRGNHADATGEAPQEFGYSGVIEGLEEETEELESKTQEMGGTAEQAFQKAADSATALMNGITLVGLSIPDLMDALDSDDASKYVDNIKTALERAQEGLTAAQNALSAGESADLGQDQLSRYLTEIDQYENKVEILKDKLAELGVQIDVEVNTAEAEQNVQELENELVQTAQQAQSSYVGLADSLRNAFSIMRESISGLSAQDVANGIISAFRNAASAIGSALSTIKSVVTGTINTIRSVVNGLKTVFNGIVSVIQQVGSTAKNVFNGVKSAISTTISAARKLLTAFQAMISPISTFKKLTGASNDTGKSFAETGKHLLKLIGYSFGIRGLFTLFRKLRSAMSESFENLAQYSDQVNSNLSTLQADLNQVKNSLSTAFAPILSVVTPILDTLLTYLAAAITAISQFFAALTGSSTYTKATKVATDYASGLSDAASAADDASDSAGELQRTLAGFDEIEKLDDASSGSGGSGSGGSGGSGGSSDSLFTTEEVESQFADFAEKIREAWENADFTEIGEIIGTKLKEGLDSIDWEPIQEVAEKIGKSIATLINGFVETSGLADSIGYTVGQAINTGVLGVDAFLTNLHWDSVGNFIADGINSAIATIDWSGLGQTIADYLNGIFELSATWTWHIDFTELGSSVATAVNTALSNIDWVSALTAAYNMGYDIADALNSVITVETFSNIGTTLGAVLGVVVQGAYTFVKGIDWSGWGSAIASSLNSFFKSLNWQSVGLTFNGAVSGIITTLSGAIEGVSWTSVGESIANAIKKINFKSLLSDVGGLIWDAIEAAIDVAAGAFNFDGTAIKSGISTALNKIGSLFSSASSKLALGAILALSGVSVPLGVALLAAGAVQLATASNINWSSIESDLGGSVSRIAKALGSASLAIGGILTFSGANVRLGVALLIAGVTASAATVNWSSMENTLGSTVSTIAKALSAASLVLGGVLTFSGANVKLGIGLMMAGIAGATAANVDWSSIETDLGGTVSTIAKALGAAELVVGALLTFSGVAPLAGVGLMASGLGAELTAINWDSLWKDLQSAITDIENNIVNAWNNFWSEHSDIAEALGIDYDSGTRSGGGHTYTADVEIETSSIYDNLSGEVLISVTALVDELVDNLDDEEKKLETIAEIAKLLYGNDVTDTQIKGLVGIVDSLETKGQLTIENILAAVDAVAKITELEDDLKDEDKRVEAIAEIVEVLKSAGLNTDIDGLSGYIESLVTNGDLTVEDVVAKIIDFINNGGSVEADAEITDAEVADGVDVDVEGTAMLVKTDTTKTGSPNIDSNADLTSYDDSGLDVDVDGEMEVSKIDIPSALKKIKNVAATVASVTASGNPILSKIGATISEAAEESGFNYEITNMVGVLRKWSKANGFSNTITDMIGQMSKWSRSSSFNTTITGLISQFSGWTKGSSYNSTLTGMTSSFSSWVKSSSFSNTLTNLAASISSVSKSGSPVLSAIAATVSSLSKNGSPTLSSIAATVSSLSKSGSPTLSSIKATVSSLSKASGFTGLSLAAKVSTTTSGNITAYLAANGGIFKGGQMLNIARFASGGLPNGGQMFVAREAGPELVGTIGGNAAVMNNDQIVASVSAGVYQAVAAAMSQSNGGASQAIYVYVGGEQITDYVIKDVNGRTIATGKCPILT